MQSNIEETVVESLSLRFEGEAEDGTALHELKASHVAEVLQGLVGLASDFSKAGAFGDNIFGTELLVQPPKKGSFVLDVIRVIQENPETTAVIAATTGLPTLSQIIWWATKSVRAEVSDFDRLNNGNVKVTWQDGTAQEIPAPAWEELQKRDRRRKKQLRQIMTPLSDSNVSSMEMTAAPTLAVASEETPEVFVLTEPDYQAVKPDESVIESQQIFEVEAQMSAIDFDDSAKWRIKTSDETRAAKVEDQKFLNRVAGGLAIRKTDIFILRVREDSVEKNGRIRRSWTVLEVKSYRKAHEADA